jgi:hypothetical protein
MTFPDRTYLNTVLPGSQRTTNYLQTPVNGGDPEAVQHIASFRDTEATGVGVVATESEAGFPYTWEQIQELVNARVLVVDGNGDLLEGDSPQGSDINLYFECDFEAVPGLTGTTLQIVEDTYGIASLEYREWSDEVGYENDYSSSTFYAIFGQGNPDPDGSLVEVPGTANGAYTWLEGGITVAGSYTVSIEWNADQFLSGIITTASFTIVD